MRPLLIALLCAAPAAGSDLTLRLSSLTGSEIIVASPGETLQYQVTGELTDANNQGLAFFAFDLGFQGGPLPQADAPTTAAMLNFATPLGLNNPAGFGGTQDGNGLVQIGGAQNTINQTFAAAPTGLVMTGIAAPGSPEVLVTGSFTAPSQAGTYQFILLNGHANVISAGATPNPFWRVEKAGIAGGSLGYHEMTVEVVDCAPPTNYCSGKVNSQGCVATLSFMGTPSLTGPDNFMLQATNVVNQQFGLYFWGVAPNAQPWLGGTLCVAPTLRRLNVHFSGGGAPAGTNCNGILPQQFPQVLMNNWGMQPGDQIYIQAWYRDPQHPDGTGVAMTDALQFTICP